MTMILNKLNKNRSWTLSGEYLSYKSEGGRLSPDEWNRLI